MDIFQNMIFFVRLYCKIDSLIERVKSWDRINWTKITDETELVRLLNENDYFSNISWVKSLVIDNTDLGARESAMKIASVLAKN
jgi:hypothetical protein